MLYYIIDEDGKVLGTSDAPIQSPWNTVIQLKLSEEDKALLQKGGAIKLKDWVFEEVVDTDDSILEKKREDLDSMSLEDLLNTSDSFSDLGLSWEEIGVLLSDKFFQGNIYKELQLHRVMIQKLLKIVVKQEELNAEDIEVIQSLEGMDNNTETILKKFRS